MVAPMSLIYYRTKVLFLTLGLIFFSSSVLASIGSVTEHQGPPGVLERNKSKLEVEKGTDLEMNDKIETAKSKMKLTFDDDTVVSLTEQSKLVIDDFVYDPNTSTGRLAMNVAMGTVRYASGAVAHNSRENVRLRTPTATISVRGTDFTMTVDEIGRSLVILLPTCPENAKDEAECWVGEIAVSNDAGQVILNQAFQATLVNSLSSPPTQPKLLDLDGRGIDNELIISPPRDASGAYIDQANAEDDNPLNVDLLDFQELNVNFLQEELLKFAELDLDFLGLNFLEDMFAVFGNELDVDMLEDDPVLPGIKQHIWVQYAYNEQEIFVRSERPPHIVELLNVRNTYGAATIIQDGVKAEYQYNDGGDVVINIVQTQ